MGVRSVCQTAIARAVFCALVAAVAGAAFFYAFLPAHAAAAELAPNGSLEDASEEGPSGWARGRWGNNSAIFAYPVPGPDGSRAARVTIENRVSGDAKWYFPRVPARGGAEYRYTNAYSASAPTYVTVEYETAGGSLVYQDIAFPGATGGSWSSVDVSFMAPPDTVALTVFHLINTPGRLDMDSVSLSEVSRPPPPPDAGNLIKNRSLEEAAADGTPRFWSAGRWGSNSARFAYPVTGHDGGRAAAVHVSSRVSGDAKWYFDDVAVSGGQTLSVSDRYKANVPTYMTARYRMSDGSHRYEDIARLPAASSWTATEHAFTVPAGAVSLTIFHLINQNGSLYVDDYRLVVSQDPPSSSSGFVTLSFDDGWRSIYNNALPILESAGMKSTQFIVTERFDFPAFMNRQEVLDLHSRGHEIGAHTHQHANLTLVNDALLIEEVERSRDILKNELGVGAVDSFAYPFGAYDARVTNVVKAAGYAAARTSDGGANDLDAADPYALRRRPADNNSFSTIRGWIDDAASAGDWLILTMHHIDDSGSRYSTSPTVLSRVVSYLSESGIPVVTMREGAGRLVR